MVRNLEKQTHDFVISTAEEFLLAVNRNTEIAVVVVVAVLVWCC